MRSQTNASDFLHQKWDVTHGTEVRVDTSTTVGYQLKAYGSVRIKGSDAAPVVFHTRPSASGGATWDGIYVDNRFATSSDPDSLSHLELSDASIGVDARSPLHAKWSTISNTFVAGLQSGDWLELRDCTVIDCVGKGVGVEGSAADASVLHCVIDNCDEFGLDLTSGSTVTVDSTTVRSCDTGINARAGTTFLSNSTIEDCPSYGAVFKDGTVHATGTSFTGSDTGLYVATDTGSGIAATVRDCTFTYNVDGVWIDDAGDSTVVIDGCTIDHNTTSGIYVEDGGSVVITDNEITYSTIGVYSYHSGPAIRSGNTIQHNSNGIKCDYNSYAVVESSTVNNNTYGVTVVNDGNPDLGHESGGNSDGYNIFKPNTTYHVRNFTNYTITAQQNYWPQKATSPQICAPKPTTLYGSVDSSYALCDPPALASPGYWLGGDHGNEAPSVPERFSLGQNYPNPFNPTTTMAFEVPRASHVQIAVYDVAGRLVATLVNEEKPAGIYHVAWDGHNRQGESVVSGIYFLRMRAGSFVDTKKLLILK